jgi:hypothetical protein
VPEDDIIYKKPRQHRVDGNIQKILDLDWKQHTYGKKSKNSRRTNSERLW